MGLVDVAVGTVASGYIGLKLMNKVLERAFFVQGRKNTVSAATNLR